MIKVLLVDDHALFRQGLRELLAKAPDLRVAAEELLHLAKLK